MKAEGKHVALTCTASTSGRFKTPLIEYKKINGVGRSGAALCNLTTQKNVISFSASVQDAAAVTLLHHCTRSSKFHIHKKGFAESREYVKRFYSFTLRADNRNDRADEWTRWEGWEGGDEQQQFWSPPPQNENGIGYHSRDSESYTSVEDNSVSNLGWERMEEEPWQNERKGKEVWTSDNQPISDLRMRRRPEVVVLTDYESDAVLQWSTGPQVAYYFGDFDVWAPRLGLTFAAALVLGQYSSLLGGVAIASVIGLPLFQSVQRNAPVKKYSYVGLWRMRVDSTQILDWSDPDFRMRAEIPRISKRPQYNSSQRDSGKVFRISFSDASGAAIDMEVPMQREFFDVRIGDEAVGIVVSDVSSLERFKCLRDCFLPDTGCWVSEYPFIERKAFMRVIQTLS